MSNIARQLRGDEGERACVYKDSLGYWTIGVGRLVDSSKKGAGLRPDEIEYLLANDIEDRVRELSVRLPWFLHLDEARQGVLINMSFQLGMDGLLNFKATLAAVQVGNYAQASVLMLQSKWAHQTPERAQRMSDQMRTGEWQYAKGA